MPIILAGTFYYKGEKNMAQREVVFVDGARTAFGRLGGTIKRYSGLKTGRYRAQRSCGKYQDQGKGSCMWTRSFWAVPPIVRGP